MKQLKALLINPCIYDFAAYSFWSAPLGLLSLGAILRDNGVEVQLLDCLTVVEEKRRRDGRAPFVKTEVDKPAPLAAIRKRFRRYGMSPGELRCRLEAMDPPDLVLVTSVMTYWYPGTREAVEIAREIFPSATIVVGGIYPSLCHDHAMKTLGKADLIVKNTEMGKFYGFIEEELRFPLSRKYSPYDLNDLPFPCFDLVSSIPFVPLLTSLGCVFRCTYCATSYMYPRLARRSPAAVVDEIEHWHGRGVNRFVLYDDNFLFRNDLYAKPFLAQIAALPFSVEFYNPNAVNAAFIDEEVATLLLRAGFKEVRIGLESLDEATQRTTGGKITLKGFQDALNSLSKAGFSMQSVHVYILAGMPFQRWQTVKDAIDYLSPLGVEINLAEYTPIPHSELYEIYRKSARYPISEEPLFQNKALFPFAWEGFTDEDLLRLKALARDHNRAIRGRVSA